MVRYLGPKIKKLKKLDYLPSFKNTKKEYKTITKSNFSEYAKRLKEKQKVKYNYGITEIQLKKYIKQIKGINNYQTNNLVKIIEMRLDTIIYNLGFAPTIQSARQLINHKKIYINSKCVNIASFICKEKDIIKIYLTQKQENLLVLNKKIPNYLKKKSKYIGKVKKFKINTIFNLKFNEQLLIEFYKNKKLTN